MNLTVAGALVVWVMKWWERIIPLRIIVSKSNDTTAMLIKRIQPKMLRYREKYDRKFKE